jgi:hypothetical protein
MFFRVGAWAPRPLRPSQPTLAGMLPDRVARAETLLGPPAELRAAHQLDTGRVSTQDKVGEGPSPRPGGKCHPLNELTAHPPPKRSPPGGRHTPKKSQRERAQGTGQPAVWPPQTRPRLLTPQFHTPQVVRTPLVRALGGRGWRGGEFPNLTLAIRPGVRSSGWLLVSPPWSHGQDGCTS